MCLYRDGTGPRLREHEHPSTARGVQDAGSRNLGPDFFTMPVCFILSATSLLPVAEGRTAESKRLTTCALPGHRTCMLHEFSRKDKCEGGGQDCEVKEEEEEEGGQN